MKLSKEEKAELREDKKAWTSLMAVAKKGDALFEGNVTTTPDPNKPRYITTRIKLLKTKKNT